MRLLTEAHRYKTPARMLVFASFAVGIGCVLTAGCASPLAPGETGRVSVPNAQALLTVEARLYNAQGPVLPHVTVYVNGEVRGVTNVDGTTTIKLEPGPVLVSVARAGYRAFVESAQAELKAGSHEKWMFALEEVR